MYLVTNANTSTRKTSKRNVNVFFFFMRQSMKERTVEKVNRV